MRKRRATGAEDAGMVERKGFLFLPQPKVEVGGWGGGKGSEGGCFAEVRQDRMHHKGLKLRRNLTRDYNTYLQKPTPRGCRVSESPAQQVRRWESAVVRVHRRLEEKRQFQLEAYSDLLNGRWILLLCACAKTISASAVRCEHCQGTTDRPAEVQITPTQALALSMGSQ